MVVFLDLQEKGKSNGDLKWRAQWAPTSFLFFDFVLEKKKKTNILIPIEFLMEQFPVRSAAATKALK